MVRAKAWRSSRPTKAVTRKGNKWDLMSKKQGTDVVGYEESAKVGPVACPVADQITKVRVKSKMKNTIWADCFQGRLPFCNS